MFFYTIADVISGVLLIAVVIAWGVVSYKNGGKPPRGDRDE